MIGNLYGRLQETRARLYAAGRLKSESLPHPVISVGNITFGGTGKTPFVELLARRFRFEGRHPAILSRGYRRRSRGVVVVSTGDGPLVGPDEGGDEPVELARNLPGVLVVVAERRVEAGRRAADLGAGLFLLDDGFQHLSLRRDANLLLLDAADPFAGGRLPPRGRLREPLSALGRADAVVFTRTGRGGPPAEALRTLERFAPAASLFTAQIRANGLSDEAGSPIDRPELSRRPFVAVCGVARPATFAASLRELDLIPEETLAFPDHHRYGRSDLTRIRRAADRTGSAWIVTTGKDAVKLVGSSLPPLVVVRLEVEVAEREFFGFLARRVAGRPARDETAVPARQ